MCSTSSSSSGHNTHFVKTLVKIIIINNYHYLSFILLFAALSRRVRQREKRENMIICDMRALTIALNTLIHNGHIFARKPNTHTHTHVDGADGNPVSVLWS